MVTDDGPPPGGWKRGEVYRILCQGLNPDVARRFELERYARMNAGVKDRMSDEEREALLARLDAEVAAEQAAEPRDAYDDL